MICVIYFFIILAAAGEWAAAAYEAQDCSVDLDWDGFPECILASESQFVVIDLLGARLIVPGQIRLPPGCCSHQPVYCRPWRSIHLAPGC
jgi:hypothetical protein